jgi:anti-sigma regulatory factor (Ser/Thr protein kinase)
LDQLAAEITQRTDCVVEEACSNREARDRIAAGGYQVVVTGVSGSLDEKLPFLESSNGHCHSRVIFLSARPSASDLTTAMRSGAYSYFSAPFLCPALREMVVRAVELPDPVTPIELLSALPNWVILQFAPEPATVDRVLQFLRELHAELEPPLGDSLTMACREILLNAAEHGCCFDPATCIQLVFARTKRLLLYQIRDPGPGFTRDCLTHAAVTNPPNDPVRHITVRERKGLRPGGFGMLLAERAMDEMLYNERGNEVLLIKYL